MCTAIRRQEEKLKMEVEQAEKRKDEVCAPFSTGIPRARDQLLHILLDGWSDQCRKARLMFEVMAVFFLEHVTERTNLYDMRHQAITQLERYRAAEEQHKILQNECDSLLSQLSKEYHVRCQANHPNVKHRLP